MISPLNRKFLPASFLLIAALGAVLFFFRLGERSLRNPDEGRYAEVAREMHHSGDWVEPTLYGVDYLRKPILFYWLIALSYKIFGVSEFAARFVPALFGWLGVLLTFVFTRRHYGEKAAFFTSLILATNLWYLQVSRYLLIDAVFSFFLTGGLFTAYHVWVSQRERWRPVFYAFLAFAFLAKGMAAIAIPVFVLVFYAAATGKLGRLKRFISPVGIAVFLAIVLPWFVAIARHEPEFLRFFFFHEHVARFIAKDFEHQEPWYFYWILLPAVFFPWSCLLGLFKKMDFRRQGQDHHPSLFLLAALVATVAFYSMSKSKLATYLLPAIPLGAILLGDACSEWVASGAPRRTRAAHAWLTIALCAVCIGSALFVFISPMLDQPFTKKIPEATRPWVLVLMAALAAECLALAACVWKGRRKLLFYSVVTFMAFISIPIIFVMESANQNYTTRHFARTLRPLLKDSDEVFIYGHPGAFYDFAFYLGRTVRMVGLGGELVFNEGDEEVASAVISRQEWEARASREGTYCLMRRSDFDHLPEAVRAHLGIVQEDARKVLLRSAG